jgi:glutathione S-transferase
MPRLLRLYDSPLSGNSYKVRLVLAHLGCDYERIELDLSKGEARNPAFLAKNPNGRVPLLELESGAHIAESNAIVYYLAQGSPYFPEDPVAAAQVMSWMFFEQNTLEPHLAGARFLLRFSGKTTQNESVIKRQQRAETALMLMELHLSVRPYFVGSYYTIADICLYAYTHLAEEAELSLKGYPAIQNWVERVTQQPGYIAMYER